MRDEEVVFDKFKLNGNLREAGIAISEFNKLNGEVSIGGKERFGIHLEFWKFYLRRFLLLRALI